ncbi:MAG: phosphoribosyltransferase family protein [Candidatus Bipolaricaulota bacterium]|nr:phosphoribosyltransferase family protein [Candidatus Bipolaricaulota bacterium]
MATGEVWDEAAEIRAWILREGVVLSADFLRVDSFLNHRVDPGFVALAGAALARAFSTAGVTCVFTAEAAGNVIAYETARRLGAAALYAKKGAARTMARALTARVRSPTKGSEGDLCASADYLRPGERVLVVDDFLHQGTTSAALAGMVAQAGAELVGFGFVIEKRPSGGRRVLEPFGVPIVSLAIIDAMDPATGRIVFAQG